MEFTSKLTEAQFSEFQRMARLKKYWVYFFTAFICGPVYIWQSVSILLRSPTPTNWCIFVLSYAGVISLLLFALNDQKRRWAEQLAELNAKRDRFIFTEEGVKSETFEGATKLIPWRSFKDWREGQQVILLNTLSSGTFILPITNLSEMEREPVRQFLEAHVPLASGGVPIIRAGTQPKAGLMEEVSPEFLGPNDSSTQVGRDNDAAIPRAGMEFTSRLTETEFLDFKRTTQTMMGRLSYLVPQILWFSMFWVFVGTDLISQKPHWGRDTYLFIAFAGGYVGYLICLKEMETKRLNGLNGSLDRFNLTDYGVEWHGPTGKTGLLRWDSFYGWREGRHVIVLENSTIKFVVLPITNLSENERRSIQQFIQMHIDSALGITSDIQIGPSYSEPKKSNPHESERVNKARI